MKKSMLLVLLSSLLLVGCGGGSGEEEGGGSTAKLKIRFHVDSKSSEGIAYKKLIDKFNAEYKADGIKATATFVARTSQQAYESQLVADKEDGTLPDIFTFDAPNCANYAHSNFLYDFTNELTSAEKDKYLTLNTYEGKVYGLPIQESSAGFYYNKQLFAQAGIDVSGISVDNPWTFDEFKAACQKLKNSNITPVDMRYNGSGDEMTTYLLYPFIYAAGGQFVDETGMTATGYFNSTASKNGFQFLKDIYSLGYTTYGIGATDFFTGKVGMYLSSGWTIPEIEKDYKEYFPNRDTWGLLPYPKDVKAASATGSWSYGIGKNSRKDKTPVIKLLKFLGSADSSRDITNATGMIPANKDVETSYPSNSPEDVLRQQLAKTGQERPVTIGYPKFSDSFFQVIQAMKGSEISNLVDRYADVIQDYINSRK